MKALFVINHDGAEVSFQEIPFLPPVGSSVDIGTIPAPIVKHILCFPTKETTYLMGQAQADVIVFLE